MLALVLTLILALYILGPDVFSRLIVSLFAPARVRNRNRSEEIARAVVISAIPVTIAYLVAHFCFHHFNNTTILKDFLLGLYGDKSLEDHSDAFFAAAAAVIRANVKFLLVPIYSTVLVWSIALGLIIRNYGKLLRKNERNPKISAMLAWAVRPWAAEWHLKLSDALLPSKTDYIRADVLTKLDVLFRGTLVEHHLGSDGSLVSITLAGPQKFKRQELLDARAAKPKSKPDPSQFWSQIEARFFIIMASEIVTINLNYVDPSSLKKNPRRVTAKNAGKVLAAALNKRGGPVQSSHPPIPDQGQN